MSIKIVAFGQPEQVTRLVENSRGSPHASEQAVTVQTVTVGEIQYLLFAVREKALVSEQATGTNGLIFFLGAETPLFEEKQYLTDLLTSKPEFEGVPLAVVFERGHQLTLKDVVNYMELFRLKERASLIKEVSWSEHGWIEELFGWVRTQSEGSKSRGGFQAVPKVVKLKPKYRESVEEESEKQYEGMLGEREVRALGVKQQQELYIDRQKQHLKQQNMETQLSNFSKNKKKMAPYDIKPTPNPKIDPNLHFFLKDPNAQPPPEVSIKIQTDEFKERPAPPPYKPKKTGINTATQIQQNELFNFDKEVKPILAILTTKALETAALEIQEEQELLKMAKYRSAYEERVKRQKEHQQRNIEEEQRVMREKDKLLQAHRARANTTRAIQHRTQCYQIANNFLKDIYHHSVSRLIAANAYPDPLANFLSAQYLPELCAKAAEHHQRFQVDRAALQGVFEKDVVGGVLQGAKGPKAAQQTAKKRLEMRTTNLFGPTRRVHLLYRHQAPQFCNFSKYLGRYFDGTLEEYVKGREQQLQEVADRVHGGQATEDQLQRAKGRDSAEFAASGHEAFVVGNQREICFTWTSNRYQRSPDNYISAGLLCLDKEGEIMQDLQFGSVPQKLSAWARKEGGLRNARETVNMDEGLAVSLAKVPENIRAIMILLRFNEAHRLRGEEAKKVKYASYGAEFWERKVSIHQRNIGEAIKWDEVIKAPEGEQPSPQNVVVVGYLLRRRALPEWWSLEDIGHVCQPVKSEEDLSHLLEELSRCYYRSWQFLKEEEQEERIERPTSSQQKKSSGNTRVKSKKVIEEPKKRIVLKVATKILSQVQIDLNSPFETVIKRLADSIEEWKEFLQICDNGWQIWIKGKKLTTVEQLAAFRKIGDLLLKRIPKVEEPKPEKVAEAEQKEDAEE